MQDMLEYKIPASYILWSALAVFAAIFTGIVLIPTFADAWVYQTHFCPDGPTVWSAMQMTWDILWPFANASPCP